MSNKLSWDEFTKMDLRVGTVVEASEFPKANNPSYKLTIDFGPDIGLMKTSAQITTRYTTDGLLDKQVIAVVNFPPKQIADFMSECLILGAIEDEAVILLQPDLKVKNGTKIG